MHNGQQPEKAGDTIVIAGLTFHGVSQELPAAQDHYLVGQLRLAGCLDFLINAKGGTAEEAAEGLLTRLLVSGRASQVLAGCLTEDGKKWSVSSAEANAEMFDQVKAPESKAAMRDALLGFVLGFFQYATASVATSRKSSLQN
ncbi:MAG TPA: hypothetical protein VF938_09955 [Candidatus Angelobacter sp.]